VAFQEVSGKREAVAVRYRLREEGGYGFQVAAYLTPAVLTATGDRALVEVFRGKTYILFDPGGSLVWNRNQGSVDFTGTWADTHVAGAPVPADAELVDAERVVSKVPGIGDVATVVLKLRECVNDCAANPDKHVCTADRYDCSCFGNWLPGGVCKTACHKTTGTYAPVSKTLFCLASEVCDAPSCNSTGYQSCCRKETDVCPAGVRSCDKKTLRTRAAHDPNATLAILNGGTGVGIVEVFAR
jgi:hypothetical protein